MRSPSIDVLRIVTVALIVWRHTFGASDLMIASVGVPFFFFLTGWLWRDGRRTVKQEFVHRWGTLGVPYVSWLVLGLAVFLTVSGMRGQVTVGLVVDPVLGGAYATAPFSTFWFITALLGVAVLMRAFDGLPAPVYAVLGVGFLVIGSWWGEVLAVVPLSIGLSIPCTGFALLGRLLHGASQRPVGRVVAVSLVPVAVIVAWWCEPLRLKHGDFGTFLVSSLCAITVTWGGIVALDWVASRTPGVSGRLSGWLGPVTSVAIVVVLVHPFVLWADKGVGVVTIFAFFMSRPMSYQDCRDTIFLKNCGPGMKGSKFSGMK